MPKNYRTPRYTMLKMLKWAQDMKLVIRISEYGMTGIYDKKTLTSYGAPTLYRALKHARCKIEKGQKNALRKIKTK